ncbi:MAG TPA: S8 family serine peptidase [Caldilineaceae bacterium]|nr:S8 family serine peptidase [Caldilineaceae bacterium]
MKMARPIGLWVLVLLVTNILTNASTFAQEPAPDVYLPFVLSANESADIAAQVTITVNGAIQPTQPDLPGLDGGDPRPLASLIGENEHQIDFVQNELVLVTEDPAAVDAFVTRWNGVLVQQLLPSEFGLDGPGQYLIRIDNSQAELSQLSADLSQLAPRGSRGEYQVSSQAGLQLLAAAAHEAVSGLIIGVNWVGKSDGFIERTTDESATGPSAANIPACCPHEFGSGGYSPNAFDWKYLNGSPGVNIGVTEAWRMLALAGKLNNKIKIAILDQGFLPNKDLPPDWVAWSVGAFDPIGTIGTHHAWHGTHVASAAMGVPNNQFGAAGPAGPVATPILIYTSYDTWTGSIAVMNAVSFGADIINMSYHMWLPATLSFTVLPFNMTTLLVRAGGVLIFASAGNDGDDVDAEDCIILCWEEEWYTPCENGGVLCVGGLGAGSTWRAGNSNFGTDGDVEFFAPYSVLVGPDAAPNNNFAQIVNGTSFSSPYAAGVAGLIWAANPSLSPDQVEGLLYLHARHSPDGDVSRYIHAQGAVHEAIGNIPPSIRIVQPAAGATIDFGGLNELTFQVAVEDYEDNNCCAVTWSSDIDGPMGSGVTLPFIFLSPGARTVTALVTDSNGASNSASITISATNTPPQVWITTPTAGQTFFKNALYHFEGGATDVNDADFQLACSALRWTSNRRADTVNGSFPAIGCTTTVSFTTNGLRMISLTGTDGQGQTDVAQVAITVTDAPPDSPPIVTVLDPVNHAFLQPGTAVTLRGTAWDPDQQSPITYEWVLEGGTVLGTGQGDASNITSIQWTPAEHIPFHCGGVNTKLYLYATDPAGDTGSSSVDIYVYYPPC